MTTQRALAVLVLSLTLYAVPLAAADIVFDLGNPSINNSVASFGVSLTFTGAVGDQLDSVQLSVLGSTPQLTNGGTDFSRFTFSPAANSPFDAWLGSGSIGLSGVELLFPVDPLAGPFVTSSPNAYNLGLLNVNIAGLTGVPNLLVSLNGGPPGLGSDAAGTINGSPVFSLADLGGGAVRFADPNGVTIGAAVVPEPQSLSIWSCLIGGLGYWATRHRGRRVAGNWTLPSRG